MEMHTDNTYPKGCTGIERLDGYNPNTEARVMGWFKDQRPLYWVPILSQKNFPKISRRALDLLDQTQSGPRFPIGEINDLLTLPEGITGWLIPADEVDTDVVCAVWAGEVYFMGAEHSITRKKHSLLGEVPDAETDAQEPSIKSAV